MNSRPFRYKKIKDEMTKYNIGLEKINNTSPTMKKMLLCWG